MRTVIGSHGEEATPWTVSVPPSVAAPPTESTLYWPVPVPFTSRLRSPVRSGVGARSRRGGRTVVDGAHETGVGEPGGRERPRPDEAAGVGQGCG